MEIGFLQETKAVIKSLVLSSPEQITIDKLRKDFRETEGYPIPYGRLGFHNVESFLCSINDTVRVQGSGSMATLHVVSNQKSAHIHDMIKAQKKTRRPRTKMTKPVSQPTYRHVASAKSPNAQMSHQYNNSEPRWEARPVSKCRFHDVSRNNSQSTSRFYSAKSISNNSSSWTNGKQAGFGYAINSGRTAKPTPQAAARQSNMATRPLHEVVNPPPAEICDYQVLADKIKVSLDIEINKCKPQSVKPKITDSLQALTPRSIVNDKPKKLVQAAQNYSVEVLCSSADDNKKQDIYVDMPALINSKILPSAASVAQANSTTAKIADLSDNKPQSLGPVANNRIADNKAPPNKTVNKHVVNSVRFFDQAPIKTCNETNYMPQVHNLAKRPPVNTPEQHNSVLYQLSNTDVYDDLDEAVPQFAANNLVFRLDFPENTVLFGQKIAPFKLPADLRKGSIIGIFVTEIYTPYKFWFHIHKEDNELDMLMNNIERFYTSLDYDEFVIPQSCHTPGQICAALYSNLWHRAEIIALPLHNKTKVFFIDYGTVSDVDVDNIKYLSSIFARVPTQAVRGSLSHIKPRGRHWSFDATQEFLSMVFDLLLYGQVTEMDTQNRIVHMILCNTNKSEIIQINKSLVEKQLAQYDEEWKDERIAQNGFRYHHPREDFPTFEMLENGEYPTIAKVVDLQNRGIDYEQIIDRKIFHHCILNNHENAPEVLRNLPFHLLNTNPFRCDIVFELHRSLKFV